VRSRANSTVVPLDADEDLSPIAALQRKRFSALAA